VTTRIWTITGIVAGGAALTVGGVLVANALLSTPEVPTLYVAAEPQDTLIVQQSSSSYDVSFTLPAEMASASDIAIGLTKLDEYDDAETLDAVIDDGRVHLNDLTLDPGDHFLWVNAGGEPVSMPITIPAMNPFIWLDGDVPNLQFNQEGRSSWSSYVDPEGKNVYRSGSPVFDESAVPLAENLPITETALRDPGPTAEQPYYYLVFSGKGGDATFVSSSLFSSATQESVAVDFETRDGEPFVVISGAVFAQEDALDRELSLRVGNFDPADPTATFMVENSVLEENATAFRFEVPALSLRPGTSNLALFLSEDGSMLEWSIRAPEVDMTRSLQVGQSVFGATNPEALQLTRFDLAYDRVSLTLRDVGGDPYLFVSGRYAGDFIGSGAALTVKDVEGETYTVADRDSDPARFSFGFALERLTKPTVWYDIEFQHPETGAVSPVMTSDVADMRQWIQVDNRTFALADFQGTTKVFFERYPFANASVTQRIINGQPMLVASGTLVDAAASDAFLRLRTGDTTIGDVRNLSTRPGEFLFQFPLSRLAEPGVWYDVVFGLSSTGALRDFPTSAVADMGATLEAGDRIYSYREWNGQLKVTFERSIGEIVLTAGEFIEVDGIPVLRLTGSLSGLAQDDAFLRLRTAGEFYDSPNLATTAGAVRFDVDLSVLTKPGTWYDVVVGNVPEGSFTDALPSIVDMTQTLTLDGRTYDFRQFDGQLKVNFAPATEGLVSVGSAEIVDADGVPTLRVDGTITGLAQDDVRLLVRTGAQQFTVPNSAVTAGEALFEVDLSALTEPGTWYDLLVVVTSTGAETNLRDSMANMSTSLTLDSRTYRFREFWGDLKVEFVPAAPGSVSVDSASIVDVDGVPTLRVEGTVTGLSQDDVFLKVRSSGQTVDVPNSAVTAGEALFEFDLSELTTASTWYDLLVGVTSTGALTDLKDSMADMSTSLTLDSRTYQFREFWGDLKVEFVPAAPGSVAVDAASIVDVAGVPTLRVDGTVTGLSAGDVFLRVRSGAQTVDVPNTGTGSVALFALDLSTLTQEGTWYDLLVGITSTGSLADLKDSMADMSTSLTLNARTYEFREWAGDLKVNFAAAAAGSVTVSSASIADVSGVPTLRVEATLTGLSAGDVFLRVRSGAQTVDVPNTGTGSAAVFALDLSTLTQSGTWYDLLVGVTSTGALTDLTTVAVGGTLPADVQIGDSSYGFREWNSDLKVNRDVVV
jgi:hypothetical protein